MFRARTAGRTIGGIAVAAGIGLAAASGPATADPTTGTSAHDATRLGHIIDVTAQEYSFSMTTMDVAAGLETVRLRNLGSKTHQFQILRINDNATLQQFTDTLKTGNVGAALAMVTARGGSTAIAPLHTQIAYTNLPAGQYIALCFVADADGIPHLAKGMAMPFQVEGPTIAKAPKNIAGVIKATMGKRFKAPATLTRGRVYAFRNTSMADIHELQLIKLRPGSSLKKLLAYKGAGELPATFLGGPGAVSPGLTTYFKVGVKPGHYLLICLVPDRNGVPHFMEGMHRFIDVK